MAGISIEFKRLLHKKSLSSLLTTFGYSTILSSGNWLVALALTYIFSYIAAKITGSYQKMALYRIYITYTIAISLITSGPFQLLFTRYVADLLFKNRTDKVLPNYIGAILASMILSTIISIPISFFLFKGLALIYKVIFIFTIAILGAIWVSTSLLSGLKNYKYIFLAFLLAYAFAGILLIFLYKYSIFYIFMAFYIGQILLLSFFIIKIILEFPSTQLVSFDFLIKKNEVYYSLAFTGLFYNLGIWIDKFLFWFNSETSQAIFGNIRTSFIYDLPITLAYLTIIPGLALLFVKSETDFAEYYSSLQSAIVKRGRLDQIYFFANHLITSVKATIYHVLILQMLLILFLIIFEKKIFQILGISLLYIPIFNLLMIGGLLQLFFIVIFNFLSYFDRREELLISTFLFFILNLIFTLIFIKLGIIFSGYGYTLSLLIASLVELIFLRRYLNEVLYWTYIASNK